jgi:large subunit ribosomal protein L4
MEVEVRTLRNEGTGRVITLHPDVFEVEPNMHVMYLAIKHYLANQRQGTHKTKERSEVSGSTRKPYRQKGTGFARAGDRRSPLWRHGGTLFGPRPRDYSLKMNRKEKQLALKSVLSSKVRDNELIVIEDFDFEKPKVKQILPLLESYDLFGKRITLVTLNNTSSNVYLSARNIPKFHVIRAHDLNPYWALNNARLFIMESAIPYLEARLTREIKRESKRILQK